MKTTTQTGLAKWIGKGIKRFDRIWADSSHAVRVTRRAASLDNWAETRPACYPLAWGAETGRFSFEIEAALLAMSPAAFAQAALDIAEVGGSVSTMYEAWRAVAMRRLAA